MKRFFSLVITTLLVFSMAAVAVAEDVRQQLTQQSTIAQAVDRGVLKVGFSTFVPWAMKDKQGEFIGFEVDVATRLASDLGLEVQFVPTKWSGIIPALLTGKFDVIIGGMSVKPERNLSVNFTVPYDYAGMAIMAHKEKAAGFNSIEAFNKENVVVVARIGTTAASVAKKYFPAANIRLFDDEAQAVQELLNGRAHAMVSSAPLPAFTVLENPDKLFLPVEGTFTREPVAFAVRKGDIDTLNVFNNWIRMAEAEGWFKERQHYWFQTKDWESRIK